MSEFRTAIDTPDHASNEVESKAEVREQHINEVTDQLDRFLLQLAQERAQSSSSHFAEENNLSPEVNEKLAEYFKILSTSVLNPSPRDRTEVVSFTDSQGRRMSKMERYNDSTDLANNADRLETFTSALLTSDDIRNNRDLKSLYRIAGKDFAQPENWDTQTVMVFNNLPAAQRDEVLGYFPELVPVYHRSRAEMEPVQNSGEKDTVSQERQRFFGRMRNYLLGLRGSKPAETETLAVKESSIMGAPDQSAFAQQLERALSRNPEAREKLIAHIAQEAKRKLRDVVADSPNLEAMAVKLSAPRDASTAVLDRTDAITEAFRREFTVTPDELSINTIDLIRLARDLGVDMHRELLAITPYPA